MRTVGGFFISQTVAVGLKNTCLLDSKISTEDASVDMLRVMDEPEDCERNRKFFIEHCPQLVGNGVWPSSDSEATAYLNFFSAVCKDLS